MEFEVVKEQIIELIKNDVLSSRNEKIFNPLIIENETAAKAVYHETYGKSGFPTRYKIITALTSISKGEDIAKEEIQSLVGKLSFRDCFPSEDQSFRKWLLDETTNMPETLPTENKVQGFFTKTEYRTIACISKVSEFPAKICVYGMRKGYIELFKGIVQHVIAEFGLDYAHKFIDQLVNRYHVADSDFMAMVSVVYAGAAKQKFETQLYREYIDKWVSMDRDYYFTQISSTIIGDWRKKVLSKLEKDGI